MAVTLRGLAWDHRRCWGPLEASIPGYRMREPAVEIVWHRRSLFEFGEGNLDIAARDYDLVIYDHPFVGDVARGGWMVALDGYLTEAQIKQFEADSVGKSWQSYWSGGKLWALPIDAAAQVASCRPDLLRGFADHMPATHAEVLALGQRLRAAGKWLGLPLVPTDAMCLLQSLAAAAGVLAGAGDGFLPRGIVEPVIAELREMAALAHPDSWGWNPIRCYDHMIAHDDVVYVPYAFGYVNYASRQDAPHLIFGDIPQTPPRGALLGGAGIGVSASSPHQRAAVDYALYLCAPEFQRTGYVTHGGQPGSLAAWTSAGANAQTRNFFSGTLATLQNAFLRPTHAGVLTFYRAATHRVAAAIKGEMSAADLAAWLDVQYRATKAAP